MLPIRSSLHYNPPTNLCFLGPVHSTSLCFLLDHTTTHLTPTPPHTWPMPMSTVFAKHFNHEDGGSIALQKVVCSHHTTWLNNPENQKSYHYVRCTAVFTSHLTVTF